MKATGTDVDTGYGQLLRRMLDDGVSSYALVVPERARAAALRVPATVRRQLDITLFLVDDLGQIHRIVGDEHGA